MYLLKVTFKHRMIPHFSSMRKIYATVVFYAVCLRRRLYQDMAICYCAFILRQELVYSSFFSRYLQKQMEIRRRFSYNSTKLSRVKWVTAWSESQANNCLLKISADWQDYINSFKHTFCLRSQRTWTSCTC